MGDQTWTVPPDNTVQVVEPPGAKDVSMTLRVVK